MKLKDKFTLIVSLCVVTILATIAIVVFLHYKKSIKENIAQQQFRLLSILADEIDDKLLTAQQLLIGVAKVTPPDIMQDPEKAQAFLDDRSSLHIMFDRSLFLFTPAGKIFVESPHALGRRGIDLSFREYMINTLKTNKPYISDPFMSSLPDKHPVIAFTVPLFDGKGKIKGILAGGIDLMRDNFLGRIGTVKIGEAGNLYLYDTDGTMIIHSNKKRILVKQPRGLNRLYDMARDGFEGTGETTTSYGMKSVASFKRMKTKNWILAANTPQAEAYRPLRQVEQFLLIASVTGLIAIFFIISYIIKYLIKPIELLTRHIEELPQKAGDDRFVNLNTKDEIGTLSVAFNKLETERKQVEETLKKSEEHFKQLIDRNPIAMAVSDKEGKFIFFNNKFMETFGYTGEDIPTVDDWWPLAYPDEEYRQKVINGWRTAAKKAIKNGKQTEPQEWRVTCKDGSLRDIEFRMSSMQDFNVVIFHDITERKRFEQQLHQSQKMEAIGTLAGGVAHDFNNILTAIIGFGQMAQKRVKDDEKTKEYIGEILTASNRAAELTHGLLAFSRKETISLKQADLNDIIRKISKMVGRIIGEDIALKTIFANTNLPVLVDESQIGQVILNLVTNARDAMPDGGHLVVQTEEINIDKEYAEEHFFECPGKYAVLTVSDTGIGMDLETRENIFEPFFTTKEVGKGTGLGLAMVYGT